MKYYNTLKKRNATANEIAKYLIISNLQGLIECFDFSDYKTEKEANEVLNHLVKHVSSISKKHGDLKNFIRPIINGEII